MSFRIKIILAAILLTLAILTIKYRSCVRDYFVDHTKYSAIIAQIAKKYDVDRDLVKAVIFVESRFDSDIIGKSGEVGLMQILPRGAVIDWAKYCKVPIPQRALLFAPELNIEIGTWYLSKALKRWEKYKAAIPLALCQYNAGGSRAERWKPKTYDGMMINNITIRSTKSYVLQILKKYREYCAMTSSKER